MGYPDIRLRRYRQNSQIRKMLRDVWLTKSDYIYPIFVIDGQNIKNPIQSMPGIYQYSLDRVLEEVEKTVTSGIEAIMLFGIPGCKDEDGSDA